jgi:hypothetical protein
MCTARIAIMIMTMLCRNPMCVPSLNSGVTIPVFVAVAASIKSAMVQAIQLIIDLMREFEKRTQHNLETNPDIGAFYSAIRVRKSGACAFVQICY